jgi:hypothetical protein
MDNKKSNSDWDRDIDTRLASPDVTSKLNGKSSDFQSGYRDGFRDASLVGQGGTIDKSNK